MVREICSRAVEIIEEASKRRSSEIRDLVLQCDSPVEQILMATLWDYWNADVHLEKKRIQCRIRASHPDWNGIFTVCLEPQRTLQTPLAESKYRVDFLIYLTRFRNHPIDNNHWPEMARLIIEVDGHDFHERTKEQASYDRKRDRELTLEGYRVVRFTGSDVFNHPEESAEDIDFHVNDLASTLLQEYMAGGRLEELITG